MNEPTTPKRRGRLSNAEKAERDAVSPAQEYASRVWSGQSNTVPRNERLERVRKALEDQGLSMEGVTL